jgi:hypothetical protein
MRVLGFVPAHGSLVTKPVAAAEENQGGRRSGGGKHGGFTVDLLWVTCEFICLVVCNHGILMNFMTFQYFPIIFGSVHHPN